MANFFGKPKAPVASGSGSRSGSVNKDGTDEHETKSAHNANTPSEFERVFKPFILKKDAELASSNWFSDISHSVAHHPAREVIVLDDDPVPLAASNVEADEDIIMLDASDPPKSTNCTQLTTEGTALCFVLYLSQLLILIPFT